jgi:hypothetical protein
MSTPQKILVIDIEATCWEPRRPAARGPRPSKRKVERPSREHLQFLLTQYSFTELGRRYRVSDNAVRKWAKSYEIMPS